MLHHYIYLWYQRPLGIVPLKVVGEFGKQKENGLRRAHNQSMATVEHIRINEHLIVFILLPLPFSFVALITGKLPNRDAAYAKKKVKTTRMRLLKNHLQTRWPF